MMHKSTFYRFTQFLCGALLLCGLSTPAWSWDGTGHMLIAQIAFDTMPRETALRIQRKLQPLPRGLGPYNFITAACWMDDIKRDPDNPWKNLSSLHYVDVLYSPHGANFEIPEGQNGLTALQATLKDIRKSTFNDEQRARQWAMIIHIVGDLHQPLHCADHHDRGGNDVSISGIPDLPENPKTHNLHFFWDMAYRYDVVQGKTRALYPPISTQQRPQQWDKGFIAWQAWRLMQKYPPEKIAGYRDMKPLDWVRESYQAACNVTYAPVVASTERPLPLSTDYVHQAHEITAKRLILAGVRLGRLLQELDQETHREKN